MNRYSFKICHLSNVIEINVHISLKNVLLFSGRVWFDPVSMVI